LAIGVALFVVMALTRTSHFGSIVSLPDASLAVFLAAGFYFRSVWPFLLFIVEAALSDYLAITYGGVSDWCVTVAYVFLLPTYASLWLAGRWLARSQKLNWLNAMRLTVAALVASSVAFLVSNGSFYLFSGRYTDLNWLEYSSRVAMYYPRYVGYACMYIALIAVIHVVLGRLNNARFSGEVLK